jgi:hypothetical protein
MPRKKFLWLIGLMPTNLRYTNTCSYCGCIVNSSFRGKHEEFHVRIGFYEPKVEAIPDDRVDQERT